MKVTISLLDERLRTDENTYTTLEVDVHEAFDVQGQQIRFVPLVVDAHRYYVSLDDLVVLGKAAELRHSLLRVEK